MAVLRASPGGEGPDKAVRLLPRHFDWQAVECCLASHVRACHSDGYLIFLDLEQDRYWSLRWDAADERRSCGGDGTAPCDGTDRCFFDREAFDPRLLAMLEERRLLAPEDADLTAPCRACVDVPPAEYRVPDSWGKPLPTIRFASAFFQAAWGASRLLARSSIGCIVERIARQNAATMRAGQPFSLERAGQLITVFNTLRPLYPRPYLCLFDSLALIEFLNRFAVQTSWVFGVTANPFRAHCWVQSGRTLLNDDLERVCLYTPIMEI